MSPRRSTDTVRARLYFSCVLQRFLHDAEQRQRQIGGQMSPGHPRG